MKTLFVLRHAKSSWDEWGLEDHERPLAPRGEKAAQRMAGYWRSNHLHAGTVLCSTAVRARQTYEALAHVMDPEAHVLLEEGLYGAASDDLVTRLRKLPDDVDEVLLVGHNPGLQDLVVTVAGDGDSASMTRVCEKFPTGALAHLTIAGPWSDVGAGVGYLEAFVVPRDLPD